MKKRGHKEQINGQYDTPPLREREDVLQYLYRGEREPHGYKEGNIRTVGENKLRTLLLEAGFTELALARIYFGTHTDINQSRKFPQAADERLTVSFKLTRDQVPSGDAYLPEQAATFDAVEFFRYYLPQLEPDMNPEDDNLRTEVLGQIRELEVIKAMLLDKGKKFFSLSSWGFTISGEVIFWLNPYDQRSYQAGWYTLDELKGWLNNDKRSPVFKSKRREKSQSAWVETEEGVVPRFKLNYEERLEAVSKGKTKDLRMLKILLLGCKFPDLVHRFSKRLR